MAPHRRKKDRLPKDVRALKDDEIMEKVFSKKVVKELKKVVYEEDHKPPETK